MDKLSLGIAYHGNRLLSHVREDLKDIVDHRFDRVVHMFSHNDWDRSANIMKEIFCMTKEFGLDFWVDNWGLAGVPGDKSHFLSYHPEAHQYFSDGTMRPVNVCFNHKSFINWTKEWIDKVYESGGRKIFWDEPSLSSDADRFSCACPVCKKLFKERYGYEMPIIPNKDAYDFQVYTIRSYFEKVTSYSKAKGMENIVCVLLGGSWGISLDNLDALGTLDTFDNIGSDPYWVGLNLTSAEVYKYVYENTRKNILTSDKFGKNHNIWIQCFANPQGFEEDVVYAAEAAYDAGARNILYWGFRGSEGNDYRARNPEIIWNKMGDANLRILNKERDKIRNEALKLIKP